MNFSDIILSLKKHFDINFISLKDDDEINEVHLLDGREKNFYDDVLYFCYISIENFPKNCIFVGDVSQDLDDVSFANISSEDFFAAYNFAEELLENYSNLDSLNDLKSFAKKTNDLSSFINEAAITLNNPFILIDRDFKTVTYSTSLPPVDEFWAKTIVSGYCSYQLLKDSESNVAFMLEDKTRKAHFGELYNYSKIPAIYSNIFKSGEFWGIVVMLCERNEMSSEYYDYLPRISHLIENIINRIDIDFSKSMSHANSLLHKLLVGANIRDLDISPLNLKLNSKYLLMTVHSCDKNVISKKIIDLICAVTNVLALSELRDNVTFLMSLDKDDTYLDRKADINNISEEENLKIGISNAFDSLDFIKKAYNQSIFAINFPSKTVLNFYSTYYFADLLKKLVDSGSESIPWNEFIHPCLNTLLDYDMGKNTKLYKTLKAYLENNSRIKETAEALFLHRNSVKYRLDKVVELCHINLEDSETVFLLQLSFHIMTYKDMGIIS